MNVLNIYADVIDNDRKARYEIVGRYAPPDNISNRSVTTWLPRHILHEKGAQRGN